MYLFPPRHLPFNCEKVKVCHGKVNVSDYWRTKDYWINLTQFEATICKTQHTLEINAL